MRNSLLWLLPRNGQIQPTLYTNDLRLIFRGQPRLFPSQARSSRHHESAVRVLAQMGRHVPGNVGGHVKRHRQFKSDGTTCLLDHELFSGSDT